MIYDLGDVSVEILDYDSYATIFEHEVKPEYKGEAENFLIEALENEDDYYCEMPGISVFVDAEKTRIGCGLRFVFKNRTPEGSSLAERMHFVMFGFAYTSNC